MDSRKFRSLLYTTVVALAALFFPGFAATDPPDTQAAPAGTVTQGSLHVVADEGTWRDLCPLKHTDVEAAISGFLARVVVTQEFENPSEEKIEAVYTFPLPQNAAVDDMILRVGDRTVYGRIKPRGEARAIYEAARSAGHVAGLLDQERLNIFTQSVSNIMPGETVRVTISYVQTLEYEDGVYTFVFPMVVGPRYIPGSATGKQAGGWSPDTDRVPDASRITPPVALDGKTGEPKRAGHDISIDVSLDAGVPLEGIHSALHEIIVRRIDDSRASVELKNKAVIPNRDFVLKYKVSGRQITDALLTHRSGSPGFFTLVLHPPEEVSAEDVTPKELVFVLDTSGSMRGFPIEKAKETMSLALDGLYPGDTFNLITFAGDTRILFPEPVPATEENLQRARKFLDSRAGSGGTEMMKAIRAALETSDHQDHIRIVCFMTDGYVGNDMEIISEVRRHPNARIFAFGIGNSTNRFLLDKMAEYGRGEVEYVLLSDDGSAAARRMHKRIRNPLLTDIAVDWAGLPVQSVYPKRIPDLFSAKPVILCGQYASPGHGVIRLTGKSAGRPFEREIPVFLPEAQAAHSVLPNLWARQRIDDLMGRDYAGLQRGGMRPELQEEITRLGMEFRLMTQFTSFVAVEELTITDGGEPRRIEVPVEMPDGVSPGGVFGEARVLAMGAGGVQGMAIAGVGVGKAASPRFAPSARNEGARPSRTQVSATLFRDAQSEWEELRPVHRKFAPEIARLVEQLTKKQQPTAAEFPFLREGKVEIRIWLTDMSEEAVGKLEAFGMELLIRSGSARLVVARLPVDKLAELAEMDEVLYVAPLGPGGGN